ncbi:TPA: hypothetical protein RVC82_004407 [Escherichia coli]|nr:hypothetical protein [Escherichia coli]
MTLQKPAFLPLFFGMKQSGAAENGRENGTGLHFWAFFGWLDERLK